MTDFQSSNPKLRLIDSQPIEYEGAKYLLLRDPLGLTEKTVLIPQPMIPALALCDGTRSLSTLRAALAIRYGLFLSTERLQEFLNTLDDTLLLDNDRSRRARSSLHLRYRQEAFRPPANAGATYPEDPEKLAEYLQNFIDQQGELPPPETTAVRGIISPHIDYERGGPVYARVWSHAAASIQQADLAIIFGTDHFSEGHPVTLTRQNYATPFGVLPTDTHLIDDLADIVGIEEAFAGELHHRTEHSIELAAVWMHYIRGGQPISIAPILTGSLDPAQPDFDLDGFLDALSRAMEGRRVLVVAAGDLAHVGPAFGTPPVNAAALAQLKTADEELLQAMCSSDARAFYSAIAQVQDQNNVCGVAPIYLALRLLAPASGQSQGYAVCPADTSSTSVVTVCGVTLQ